MGFFSTSVSVSIWIISIFDERENAIRVLRLVVSLWAYFGILTLKLVELSLFVASALFGYELIVYLIHLKTYKEQSCSSLKYASNVEEKIITDSVDTEKDIQLMSEINTHWKENENIRNELCGVFCFCSCRSYKRSCFKPNIRI